MEMKSPRINLVIDRDKAAAVGLNATQIQNALYDALGPKWSSTIYGDTAQYRVLLELDPKYQGAGRLAARRSRSRRRSARWCRSSRWSTSRRRSGRSRSTTPASCRRCRCRSACARASRSARPPRTSSRSPIALLPPTITTSFEGSGQGVPAVDEQPRPAALRRDRRRLHRARRALRELHPPDHDSLRACRRPASARWSRSICSATS